MGDTDNQPKVLVEFSPEEVAWLTDRLHEEWARTLTAKAVASTDEARAKVDAHQEMQNRLRNRLLDNASKQRFGDL